MLFRSSYSFLTLAGNYIYTVQLWNETQTLVVATQVFNTFSAVTISNVFTGLTSSTNYNVVVQIIPGTCPSCQPTICPAVLIKTSLIPCAAVTNLVVNVTYPIIL